MSLGDESLTHAANTSKQVCLFFCTNQWPLFNVSSADNARSGLPELSIEPLGDGSSIPYIIRMRPFYCRPFGERETKAITSIQALIRGNTTRKMVNNFHHSIYIGRIRPLLRLLLGRSLPTSNTLVNRTFLCNNRLRQRFFYSRAAVLSHVSTISTLHDLSLLHVRVSLHPVSESNA